MRKDIEALLSLGRSQATADSDTITGRARNVSTIIAVVVIGIVSLVGILIFAEVEQAMPDVENTELEGATDGIMTGMADALGLVPIVMIVLLASVVIGVVQRMRGM